MDLFMLFDANTLGALAVGLVALKAGYHIVLDKLKYSASSDAILEKGTLYLETKEEARILDALKVNKSPTRIDLDKLSKEDLLKAASEANAALIHFSGNCALLSRTLMYNLLNTDGVALAVKNTYPVTEAISSEDASKMLLGQDLQATDEVAMSIDELEEQLLNAYKETGEQVFVIEASGYSVPVIGETGHCFNAIVCKDDEGNATIQFVDAWKTSNPTPTKEELRTRYTGKDPSFCAFHCTDKTLIKSFSLEEEDTIATSIAFKSRFAGVSHKGEDDDENKIIYTSR